MKDIVKIIIGIIGIASGLYALLRFSLRLELAVGLISLSFGVLAIIWTFIAKYSLSPKSDLRVFTNNFLAAIIFLLLFSLVTTIRQLQNLLQHFIFVEYFFITATFLLFVIAAYQIRHIGQKFGFEKEAKNIKRALKK